MIANQRIYAPENAFRIDAQENAFPSDRGEFWYIVSTVVKGKIDLLNRFYKRRTQVIYLHTVTNCRQIGHCKLLISVEGFEPLAFCSQIG
jgi:hypothetical protein